MLNGQGAGNHRKKLYGCPCRQRRLSAAAADQAEAASAAREVVRGSAPVPASPGGLIGVRLFSEHPQGLDQPAKKISQKWEFFS